MILKFIFESDLVIDLSFNYQLINSNEQQYCPEK